jgi:NAD(P)-dependent dehydrogenase (short-subunit alcohol dehydrogenase family)
MSERGWGRIVFMSSGTFLTGSARLVDYAASKGAVVGLTRSLALALGDRGITVNAVTTGRTLTEGLVAFFDQGETTLEASIASRQSQAIKRLAKPEDIAGVFSFLASEDSAYLTGQLINVDGGRSMH